LALTIVLRVGASQGTVYNYSLYHDAATRTFFHRPRTGREIQRGTRLMRAMGNADLPLHGGHVPSWLADRMAGLGRVMVEAIVHHYGRDELLRRLAHPFWFQSFGAVMGMDWHSSGITTSVIGALKRGLAPVQRELGIHVCGGRGRHSRQTPAELKQVGERTGLDADALAHCSRLVAKVDSAAVQDGYDLYLHAFFVTDTGNWCVVQQGMNVEQREARRYHWLSELAGSFLDSPHTGVDGRNCGFIINLADERARRNRQAGVALVCSGPDRIVSVLRRLRDAGNAAPSLFPEMEPSPASCIPHLRMPAHHEVRATDVLLKRLHGTLAAAADRGPTDFADLLMMPGVGRRTVESLALVAEVIHGTPSRFTDPARFSMAHGGKDGHPFPVPLKVYDQTIQVLKRAIGHARLGNADKLSAIQKLDQQARQLERVASGPTFAEFIERERQASRGYGGRWV
jgi:uncharacterized protein